MLSINSRLSGSINLGEQIQVTNAMMNRGIVLLKILQTTNLNCCDLGFCHVVCNSPKSMGQVGWMIKPSTSWIQIWLKRRDEAYSKKQRKNPSPSWFMSYKLSSSSHVSSSNFLGIKPTSGSNLQTDFWEAMLFWYERFWVLQSEGLQDSDVENQSSGVQVCAWRCWWEGRDQGTSPKDISKKQKQKRKVEVQEMF